VSTILISIATRRVKSDEDLRGLVYSLTPKPSVKGEPWYYHPVTVGAIVLAITLVLNIVFW
jgi:SSS family solute:Na+ symporter